MKETHPQRYSVSVLGALAGLFWICFLFPPASPADPVPQPIALTGGTLIDGTGATPVPDAVVLIKGNTIAAVGTNATIQVPEGAEIVKIRGATILPGFINAHVHKAYNDQLLKAWAQAGVLTVRDLAAFPPYSSYPKRDRMNLDPENARLVAAGPQMTAVKGFVPSGYPSSVFIDSAEEAVRQANRILDGGADLLKVMIESNWRNRAMPLEYAKAIAETAHERRKKVSVHVSLSRDIEAALAAGADDLAHMVIDELPLPTARKAAVSGVYWTPTIEVWKGSGIGKNVVANLRLFVEAGGRVALGTDYNGARFPMELGMPMKEIGWMREAGMTPMQIIVAATCNAADACGLGRESGTVEAGKSADLLVVDGDPLADINCLTKVRLVMHAGRIIRKARDSQ